MITVFDIVIYLCDVESILEPQFKILQACKKEKVPASKVAFSFIFRLLVFE